MPNQVQKIQEHSDVNQWNYVKGKTILLMMHQEDLIQERRLQAVDCSLDLYSYGKEKNLSYSGVTCVGNGDPEIKKDEKSLQYNKWMMYLRMLENKSQIGVNWRGS